MSIFSLNLHVLYTLSPQLAALGHLTIYNGRRGVYHYHMYLSINCNHYARIFLSNVQNSLDSQKHIYKSPESLKVISFKNLSSSSRIEKPLCVCTGRAKQKYEDRENNDDKHDDNTIIITIFNNEEFVIFFKTCVCMLAQREIAELILWPIGQKQTIQERQYY